MVPSKVEMCLSNSEVLNGRFLYPQQKTIIGNFSSKRKDASDCLEGLIKSFTYLITSFIITANILEQVSPVAPL